MAHFRPLLMALISDASATGRALLAAGTKAAARDELDVYSIDETNALARDAEAFAASLAASLAGASLTLRDQDVATVIEATSLTDGPLAAPGLPMTYVAGVLTAGVAMDLAGAGLPLGTSVAWRFGSSDRERTGIYTVTDEGADDPGGHAPTFDRRADFNASGDFATGDAVRVADSGVLLRVAVPDPFTLDADPIKLDPIDPGWIASKGFLALLAPASGDAPEGRTLLADGAGYWRWTSDPVSALLAAASLSAARTALGVETTPVVVTADRTAAEGEVLFVDASSGAITVTLPAAAGARRAIRVKKVDVSANAVTVDGAGAELVDGAATLTLTTQYEAVTLHADGVSTWGEF